MITHTFLDIYTLKKCPNTMLTSFWRWHDAANIKKRGRDYEQNIEKDYLEKINSGYWKFLKTQQELKVKIIDISDRDLMENRADYLWILEQICI